MRELAGGKLRGCIPGKPRPQSPDSPVLHSSAGGHQTRRDARCRTLPASDRHHRRDHQPAGDQDSQQTDSGTLPRRKTATVGKPYKPITQEKSVKTCRGAAPGPIRLRPRYDHGVLGSICRPAPVQHRGAHRPGGTRRDDSVSPPLRAVPRSDRSLRRWWIESEVTPLMKGGDRGAIRRIRSRQLHHRHPP